jgi:hypothetical protein
MSEVKPMDNLHAPPWRAAADETIVSDDTEFANCETAIAAVASRSGGAISDRVYSVSPKWGRVLRASIGAAPRLPSALSVICWSQPGPEVEMVVKVAGGGP